MGSKIKRLLFNLQSRSCNDIQQDWSKYRAKIFKLSFYEDVAEFVQHILSVCWRPYLQKITYRN